jgi:branched-chain amino acid transport system substrate-binding protein
MVKKIFLIFYLSFPFITPQNLKYEDEFKYAINLYENLQYERAAEVFKKIVINYEYNSKTTASQLLLAKSFIKLNKFEEAKTELLSFSKQYPESRYISEAYCTLSKIHYEEKDYLNSFKALIPLLHIEDDFYKNNAQSAAERLALNYLTSNDLILLKNLTDNKKTKSFILLLLVKLNYQQNNFTSAKKFADELLFTYPGSVEREETLLFIKKINENENIGTDEKIIGVILPLAGEDVNKESASAANEILEGIKYAVSEFNKEHSDKIGLLIRNSEFKREKLEAIKREFQNIYNLKCIIGPIFSREVREALEVFFDTDIPIISPTATDNDLTEINENFFQANPSISLRGKIMAQYVFFIENKRTIAVLNSVDGYSPLIAGNFIDEFEKLGGKVLVKETFRSKSTSLAGHFDKIYAVINSLDGIFIPLSDKVDAPVIISELVKKEITIPIYGNQDWTFSNMLSPIESFNNKLLFTTDNFIEFNDEDFQNHNKKFFSITKKDINRNVLYGYDAANYILTVLRNSFNNRNSIRQKMLNGLSVSGFHNNILFGKNRMNKYLNIVRYTNGRFELADKFRLSEK